MGKKLEAKQNKLQARHNKLYSIQTSLQDLYKVAEEAYKEAENSLNNDSLTSYMMKKGTLKDRLSTLLNQIQSNPTLCLSFTRELVRMCRQKDNRKESLAAIEAMKQACISTILTQPLLSFSQALGQRAKAAKKDKKLQSLTKQQLSQMYLWHKVKQVYSEYLKSIDELLQDNLFAIKKQCINILMELSKFPELKNTILSSLVNKFGDSDAQVVNELTKLLRLQVSMDFTLLEPLLKNIEQMLFRKNLSKHAQFYAVNLLTNLNLPLLHQKHLKTLMELFFKLFRKLIVSVESEKNEEVQQELSSKLFLSVVKGLNKIFPIVKGDYKQFNEVFEQKVDSLYKIFHTTKNTKVKIQLLLFLYQNHQSQLPDRYYRALYDFLNEQELHQSSLLELFFDLLLISLKQDNNLNRVMAFCKRILQVCFTAAANFTCTCLILLSKLLETHTGLKTMLNKVEGFLDEGEEGRYDMSKRQPGYARAECSCLWELVQLKNHFHPMVRRFSQLILEDKPLEYSGNPLLDFSLTGFIQKLCLRSQRKSESWRLKNKKVLARVRPSKYETLVQKPVEQLGEDEQFLGKYLERKRQIGRNRKKNKGPDDIEEYADMVIEKEMERLNGKEDDDDMDDDQQIEDGEDDQMDDGQEFDGDEFEDGDEVDEEEMDGLEDGEEFWDEDGEGLDEQEFDEDMSGEQDEQSEEKDFNQVFDNIGQEQKMQKTKKRKQKKLDRQSDSKKNDKNSHKNSHKKNQKISRPLKSKKINKKANRR